MAQEFEKVVAKLLKPQASNQGGETPERVEQPADSLALGDNATLTAAAPERRVGFARVGYTESA